MTSGNICHLEGVIQGDCWTRWPVRRPGQVRFWLSVARGLAGAGRDLLLCAVQPKSVDEVRHYENELRAGRAVQLSAVALSQVEHTRPIEDRPGVIFVAESCGFDGAAALGVHRQAVVQGKMAAAADNSGAELLPLEGSR